MLIRLHGVHCLQEDAHDVTVRVTDNRGRHVLQCSAYCEGVCYTPFATLDEESSAECATFTELALELDFDGILTSVPLKPPYLADVERRKIVPRIVQIDETAAIALSFQVSPEDREGYRARLTAFLEHHDPSNLAAVPEIMDTMSEIQAFSFAWNDYNVESIRDRLDSVVRRYNLDESIADAFRTELEGTDSDKWLGLLVDFTLANATLEANDLSHGSRALSMIRKYHLNEEEVMQALAESDDPDDFLLELRRVFGPEPLLTDFHAYPPVSAAAAAPKPADSTPQVAANDADMPPAAQEHRSVTPHMTQQQQQRRDSLPVTIFVHESERGSANASTEIVRKASSGDAESPLIEGEYTSRAVDNNSVTAPVDDPFEVPEIPPPASGKVEDVAAPVAPRAEDPLAVEEKPPSPLRQIDDFHWPEPREVTEESAQAAAGGGDSALKQALLHLGRERDSLERHLAETRAVSAQQLLVHETKIEELERRVKELDDAVLGYRDTTSVALQNLRVAETRCRETEAALEHALNDIDTLKKKQARLCRSLEESAPRLRLHVRFDTVDMLIPTQANVCLGDVRQAVISRAIRMGLITEAAAAERNLQLKLGPTVLFEDDTVDEMQITEADCITLTELGAIAFADAPRTSAAAPIAALAVGASPIAPVVVPFAVTLPPEQMNELASHESLERRLVAERQRIEHEDMEQQRSRAYEAVVKRLLDCSRMRLVDRAAYGRTEEARAQARAAIARIDSSLRVGLTPEGMLAIARHADLTSQALSAAESKATTVSPSSGLPLDESDVAVIPQEMASKIEKRRAQCTADLKEMISTVQSRLAIPPARLPDAEALVSKARSYVSLASSLSVDELQSCLRDMINFATECRKTVP